MTKKVGRRENAEMSAALLSVASSVASKISSASSLEDICSCVLDEAVALLRGLEPPVLPPETALGAVQRYVAGADPEHYDPTNFAFGLLPPLEPPVRGKKARRLAYTDRALAALDRFLADDPLLESRPAGAASA